MQPPLGKHIYWTPMFSIKWTAFPACPLCSTSTRCESIFQRTICSKWVQTRCLGEEAGPEDTIFYRGHPLLSFTCRLCYMGSFLASWWPLISCRVLSDWPTTSCSRAPPFLVAPAAPRSGELLFCLPCFASGFRSLDSDGLTHSQVLNLRCCLDLN